MDSRRNWAEDGPPPGAGRAARARRLRVAALTRLLLTRMPDYQANLIARRFLSVAEHETYVRHNVRTLRAQYPPARLWRMLIRYLYEYQYLGFSAVGDPRSDRLLAGDDQKTLLQRAQLILH